MRGIFTASYLTEVERVLGKRMIDVVDLVVGTSTGGIIGLGLAAGYPAQEMLDFYLDHGSEIFSGKRLFPLWLFTPKYSRKRLDEILRERFGEMTMNQLQKHVCVTAHELVAGTTRVWKDDHAPGLSRGGTQLVWKVAAATAAAPTFFAPAQVEAEDSHVDGGVWANNPALVGITEAVRYYGCGLEDIRLVSVGTTSRVLRVESHEHASRMGGLKWGFKALDLLQGTVSMASARQASLLLPDGHYHRADSEIAEKIKLDDVDQCRPLQALGKNTAANEIETVKRVLALP
jgi:patatin-like phospholipase/acyl hydrolase